MNQIPIAFSFIVNKWDTYPSAKVQTWANLSRNLSTKRDVRPDKNGLALLPCTFKDGGKRVGEDVEALTMFTLDIDDGTPPEALCGLWEQGGLPLACVVWSTHSSTPEKQKWRAVFPLIAPMPANQWKVIWRKLCYHLAEGKMDSSCSEPNRLYYLPSCPPGRQDQAFAWAQEGEFLDPDQWPEPPSDWSPTPPKPRRERLVEEGEGEEAIPSPERLLVIALGRLEWDGRNNTALWLACQMRDNRYSEGQAEGLIAKYVGFCPVRPGDPFTEEEALKCVRNAYKEDPRDPWRKDITEEKQLPLAPWTDYNQRATVEALLPLLEKVGFIKIEEREDGAVELGHTKRQGHIATLTTDPLMLHVFVAVGGPLGKLASEEPFWVYAQAEHGGDGRSAARELGKRGYGEQPGERVAREATEKLTPNTNARLVSPETFNLTDAGNAERLVARHGASIRYSPSLGWIIWTGKRWERDESGGIHRMALETIRSIYAEAAAVMGQAAGLPPDDTEFKALDGKAKAIRKHAISSENHARLNAMVDRAHTLPGVYISPDELDRDLWLFNCQNGTIDLRTGELKPHDRSDFITKSSPVTYDPKATAPLWERCLETWQPDISVRQFLARAAGYTLTGDTGEETVFFLFGDGGNGKSKFTSSLEFIMGDYAARIRSDVLMQSKRDATPGTTPDLERLPGTRLLIVSEIEEGARIREGFLKDMTGGESVFVNPKYKPGFQFKPRFKPWLYGNHKPTFRGSDKGIRRRLPLIPFTATIPADERDTALEAKLRAEAPGILAWAVRGCLEWKKGRLQPPSAVTEATESYHDAQDVFGQWIRTSCALVEKAWTPTAELRRSYEAFCEDEGFRATLDGNSFTERLQQAGCQDKRDYRNGKRVRGWSGIALLTDRTNPSGQQDTEDSKNTKSVNIKSLRGDFTVNAVPAVPVSKAEDDDLPDPYADTPGGSRYAPPVTAEDEAEEEVF